MGQWSEQLEMMSFCKATLVQSTHMAATKQHVRRLGCQCAQLAVILQRQTLQMVSSTICSVRDVLMCRIAVPEYNIS